MISFTSHVGVLMITSGGPRVGKCSIFRLFILSSVTKKCPVQFHDRELDWKKQEVWRTEQPTQGRLGKIIELRQNSNKEKNANQIAIVRSHFC